ncbi:hypothetical protein [Heyndrickxia acidicola]|uniref:hypothetical protein n=1 Tax=Heyndrickxia acidicola TaxID=209389 RepID=UPI000A9A0DF3|nr:hypothetical protein [Heyndrickxia acidicola]
METLPCKGCRGLCCGHGKRINKNKKENQKYAQKNERRFRKSNEISWYLYIL